MEVTRRVALNGLHMHGFHGVYEEERAQGNSFEIDAWVEEMAQTQTEDVELEKTMNYELLLELIEAEMRTPTALLESLANRILIRMRDTFPSAQAGGIKIQKLNPPLNATIQSTSVEQSWKL